MFLLRKYKIKINNDLIKDKRIPILTLDKRWHELFKSQKKTFNIKQLERQINNSLKKQGKLVNDIKNLKKIKTDLMNEIVTNIPETNKTHNNNKTMERNKKLIEDVNKKIDDFSNELSEIPFEIKILNEKLMLESVEVSYNYILNNKNQIGDIALWIEEVRNKLKENIIKKQILEEESTKIYSYMHDVLGADVIEIFDESFDSVIKRDKIK